MKKVFLGLALVFSMAFAVSIGHAEKSAPVMEQRELFVVSSNAP